MAKKTLKKAAPTKKPRKASTDWNRRAKAMLEDLVDTSLHFPALRKRGPRNLDWQAGVRVVSSAEIQKLNARYRQKDYATDVLSFGAPEPFWSSGYLGELVIALPVLKKQAREYKHSPQAELAILLAHGLLHLLGMDHEKGARHAKDQAEWEARLLAFGDVAPDRGLIERTTGKARTRKASK